MWLSVTANPILSGALSCDHLFVRCSWSRYVAWQAPLCWRRTAAVMGLRAAQDVVGNSMSGHNVIRIAAQMADRTEIATPIVGLLAGIMTTTAGATATTIIRRGT